MRSIDLQAMLWIFKEVKPLTARIFQENPDKWPEFCESCLIEHFHSLKPRQINKIEYWKDQQTDNCKKIKTGKPREYYKNKVDKYILQGENYMLDASQYNSGIDDLFEAGMRLSDRMPHFYFWIEKDVQGHINLLNNIYRENLD